MYKRQDLTEDGLHPTDRGHELLAEEMIRVLEQARKIAGEREEENPPFGALPQPLTANAYENARLLNARSCTPKLLGFLADREEKPDPWNFFRNGWIGKQKGDRMELEAFGSCLAVQYRKSARGGAPKARLILDGDREHARILDGSFQEDWGDCLYLEPLLHHGPGGRHRVEIELVEDGVEGGPAFYLLSLIAAGQESAAK